MADKQVIQEEIISLDSVKDVGGLQNLRVKDVTESFTALIVNATAKKTQWGDRVDYELEGQDGYGHIMSSWIFMSKKRYKPSELIGQKIKLSPYSEKKLLLEVF